MDTALGALDYNSSHSLSSIKRFSWKSSEIKIDRTEVIPVPFFHALNWKMSEDYITMAKPSTIGEKMA